MICYISDNKKRNEIFIEVSNFSKKEISLIDFLI